MPLFRFGPNGAMFGKASIHGLACDRLDVHPVQRCDQIAQRALGIEAVIRSEAPPETPAHALQNALAPHIVGPTLRPVVAVAIALDRKAPSAFAFHHHIDRKSNRSDLRRDMVASLDEGQNDRLFEFRLAPIHKLGGGARRLGHRVAEMRDDSCLQIVGVQLLLPDRTHEH
jgi:hypothetical protein